MKAGNRHDYAGENGWTATPLVDDLVAVFHQVCTIQGGTQNAVAAARSARFEHRECPQ